MAAPLLPNPLLNLDLPQTRHRSKNYTPGDGGFLRVSAGRAFVARTVDIQRYGKVLSAKCLICLLERVKGIEPS